MAAFKETKKLKEFTHEDLNLPEASIEPEGVPEKFIVFQTYYPLLHRYVPFWADEKIYAFQKDGHIYRVPENIKDHIELEHPVKTPWWYYSGFIASIILIAVLLVQAGFAIYELESH
ncbi:hypothetical protein [Fluviicola chungangensis]|uniref:Uncharacterized protein n=1 Tax=Fluviicola chungangensis TaxID=2597671 RepID=A0A556N3I6_9FLAO|nr:hypothetical protein [Fluviicola chungangensis]TSJ46777.1 hypothetical protein FO442_06345 [Fluviicola chungangensis]